MSRVPITQLAFQQLEMTQANVRTQDQLAEGSWEGLGQGWFFRPIEWYPDEIESMQALESDACKSECGLQH